MSETQGRRARYEDGTRVFVTDGKHEGRSGVIIDTTYTDEMEAFKARSGDPAVANFAEVDYYTVRTRDAFADILNVSPEEVVPTTGANQGRITPEGLLQEHAKEERRAIDIQHRGLSPENAAPGSDQDLGPANADEVVRRFRGEANEPGEGEAGEGESLSQVDQDESPEQPSGPDYDSRSVQDLEAEVEKRDLVIESGTGSDGNIVKADLVSALEADDAGEVEEEK